MDKVQDQWRDTPAAVQTDHPHAVLFEIIDCLCDIKLSAQLSLRCRATLDSYDFHPEERIVKKADKITALVEELFYKKA